MAAFILLVVCAAVQSHWYEQYLERGENTNRTKQNDCREGL